jgi:hypothetical protein
LVGWKDLTEGKMLSRVNPVDGRSYQEIPKPPDYGKLAPRSGVAKGAMLEDIRGFNPRISSNLFSNFNS